MNIAFWRRGSKKAILADGTDLSSMSMGQLEDAFKHAILKQIEDVQHLAIVTGMMMVRRTTRDEVDYKNLGEALGRFRGAPELEPLRQAAIKELKRRADEEGDAECARILERVGGRLD